MKHLIILLNLHFALFYGIDAYCRELDLEVYSIKSDTTNIIHFQVSPKNSSEFKLFRIRDRDSLGFIINKSHRITILNGHSEMARIMVPSAEEVKNFQISDIQKHASGFKIVSSWGGGDWLWDVIHYFEFSGNDCFLVSTLITQYGPNKTPEKNRKKCKPPIRASEFSFQDYLE